MQNTPEQKSAEDRDANNTTESNELEAGRKAIEAGRLADPKDPQQQQKEEADDAEAWRNEG